MATILAPPYSQYKSYSAGDYVTFDGSNYYICLKSVAAQQSPRTSPNSWQQVFNSSGSSFITSVSNTATINLTVTAGDLTADAIAGGGTVTQINAGTGITLTPSPIVGVGSVALTVPVTAILGGTGQTTYAAGDVLYASAINTLAKLTAGSNGQVLTLTAGIPSWATPTTGTVTSVGATSPITSSGGATPTISTSMATNRLIGRGTAGAGVMEEITLGTGLSLTGTTLNAAGITTLTVGTTTITSGTTQRLLYDNAGVLGEIAVPTAGKILRSDGTSFAASTSTFADTYGVSTLLYASSANVVTGLATVNSAVLTTSSGGVPTFVMQGSLLVNRTYASSTTRQTGTTTIPMDNTIPQKTEGDEYLTITHTPLNTANRLVITAQFQISPSALSTPIIALFQDTASNALAAAFTSSVPSANYVTQAILRYEMAAGTTSATTFKIRIGMNVAGTLTVNGFSGNSYFGGTMYSHIQVEEFTI